MPSNQALHTSGDLILDPHSMQTDGVEFLVEIKTRKNNFRISTISHNRGRTMRGSIWNINVFWQPQCAEALSGSLSAYVFVRARETPVEDVLKSGKVGRHSRYSIISYRRGKIVSQ